MNSDGGIHEFQVECFYLVQGSQINDSAPDDAKMCARHELVWIKWSDPHASMWGCLEISLVECTNG